MGSIIIKNIGEHVFPFYVIRIVHPLKIKNFS